MNTHRLLLLTLLLAGCGSRDELTRAEALATAHEQIRSDYPRMPLQKMTTSSFATGKAWIVRYDPGQDALGGSTTVVIDRRSSEVIAVLGGQ